MSENETSYAVDIGECLRAGRALHVCVDMQRLFTGDSPWKTPWFDRILPNVGLLAAANPCRTLFTRFIPAAKPGEGQGAWRAYYRRWAEMTVDNIGADMLALAPELGVYVPPAAVLDKPVYSPWWQPQLHRALTEKGIGTLIVSGGETDVCVLATVLGAIDLGYRVVLARDALCGSSDETHDATLRIYGERFNTQVAIAATQDILAAWDAVTPD